MHNTKTLSPTATKDAPMPIDATTFRQTLALWASGVTVLTTLADDGYGAEGGRPVGITASSFTSLSLDPPQVLVSVNKRLYTHDAIKRGGFFAVSILHAGQEEIGKRFAGLIPEVEDRFAGLETHTGVTGSPILSDALAWVDCTVHHTYDGEDHTIFVGEVQAAGVGTRVTVHEPLIYFNRNWRALEPLE